MIGYNGNGTLNITGGGVVDCPECYMGYFSSSNAIKVEGPNSKFICEGDLRLGVTGDGTLTIQDHGLVQVAGTLNVGFYDSLINMTSGGMLALWGEADDSLAEFDSLIVGTDAIQWWDDSIGADGGWTPLTAACYGYDYKLDYLTEGDLAGYTLLTVGEGYLPGDANRDGQVDAGDATILAGNWQADTSSGQVRDAWSVGDFNQDGMVDAGDATILAGNWQAGTNMTAVPEPSVIIMLIFATGLGFVLRKRS
jgi:T5SS/PEP-CTERM-associated repeat protein